MLQQMTNAVLTLQHIYNFPSQARGHEPKDLSASFQSFHYILLYYLGFFPVIKGVVELSFIIVSKILSYPEFIAALQSGHIYNSIDSLHV